MARVGYCRVSTRDQHPEIQAQMLEQAGCEKIFTDHGVSGTKASRPELDACLAYLRKGDVLVVTKLDRLGRSVKNLCELADRFRAEGVDLVVIQQGIDTTTPAGKLLFHVLAAIAEFEHDLIVDRTMDGLAAARKRGKVGGHPMSYTPIQAKTAATMKASGNYTAKEIGEALGVSRATVYRMLDAAHKGSQAALS